MPETANLPQHSTRETCRVCGSAELSPLFSLGDIYVSDFIPEPHARAIRTPLELVYCDNCTLVQLRHTGPQELLYTRHYWYRSGINPVISRDLQEIAQIGQRMLGLKDADIVLDIGANDGTMLKYYPESLVRVGCEPALNLIPELRKVTPWVIEDFWTYENWRKLMGDKKARFVTAFGMLYDMEDPGQFVRDVARVLERDGVFVAQLMCLRPMLEKNDLGNICHEHLEYYSYDSLKYLFEHNGLEIFGVEENDINGGSYRLFSRHFGRGSIDYDEKYTRQDFIDFYNRLLETRRACVSFVRQETGRGQKIYAYGASTKGNTILQFYGLDHRLITAAADKDPRKWGKYTVGSLIPIVSEEEARKEADYFLVLPWAFFATFYERERAWMERGGKFIVPLPRFRVVGADDPA